MYEQGDLMVFFTPEGFIQQAYGIDEVGDDSVAFTAVDEDTSNAVDDFELPKLLMDVIAPVLPLYTKR